MIIALDENETVDFVYKEVKWKIRALPFLIKKKISSETQAAVMGAKSVDFAELAILAVKYGLTGWDNLSYSNGQPAICTKEKDSNGIECLDQKSIELIYRTSVFDKISEVIIQPDNIPKYMDEAVSFKNKEVNAPDPVVNEEKK